MMKASGLKNLIRNNKGTSMVEMLICFLLLSILMVSASQMIASAMKTYSNSKKGITGREVADLLADHIEGVIEKADAEKGIQVVNNDKINLTDNEGRKVLICVDGDGYLDLVYGKFQDEHWRFDESLYRGYSITSMQIYSVEPADPADADPSLVYIRRTDYRPGTFRLVLKLNNPKTGTYEAVRYIYCMDAE